MNPAKWKTMSLNLLTIKELVLLKDCINLKLQPMTITQNRKSKRLKSHSFQGELEELEVKELINQPLERPQLKNKNSSYRELTLKTSQTKNKFLFLKRSLLPSTTTTTWMKSKNTIKIRKKTQAQSCKLTHIRKHKPRKFQIPTSMTWPGAQLLSLRSLSRNVSKSFLLPLH